MPLTGEANCKISAWNEGNVTANSTAMGRLDNDAAPTAEPQTIGRGNESSRKLIFPDILIRFTDFALENWDSVASYLAVVSCRFREKLSKPARPTIGHGFEEHACR
jgi:hypothetical protein